MNIYILYIYTRIDDVITHVFGNVWYIKVDSSGHIGHGQVPTTSVMPIENVTISPVLP